MGSARELVTRRVARRSRRFPQLDLAPLDTGDLASRDAALALAIDHAVARRWLTLRTVLQHRLARPWERLEPRLQGVLLVGAAQLLLLDRVPEHAAVNDATDLAKRLVRPGAGGLVNAVLRGVARMRERIVTEHDPSARNEIALHDGRAWRLTEPVLDQDPLVRLAQQTSHAETLLARWTAAFGRGRTAELAAHGLVHPPVIIAGPMPDAAEGAEPHEEAGFQVLSGSHETLKAILAANPGCRVQDPTAARPVEATRSLAPRLIVDACAGLGTKTRQLAALHPGARIVATDVDPGRLEILRAACAGIPAVEVIEPERRAEFSGRADLLVLDVPCSNTGVLARRVEAKYRFQPDTLRTLVDLQRQIVADTLPLLARRGHLLYATCSIEAAENGEQAEWIMRWHPFRTVWSELRLPRGRPGDAPAHYADGGYFALLERSR